MSQEQVEHGIPRTISPSQSRPSQSRSIEFDTEMVAMKEENNYNEVNSNPALDNEQKEPAQVNVNTNNATTTNYTTGEPKEQIISSIDLKTKPLSPANDYQKVDILKELKGQYLELDVDGEIVVCQIKDISRSNERRNSSSNVVRRLSSNSPYELNGANSLTKKEKRKEKVEVLLKESTNRWLYVNDMEIASDVQGCGRFFKRCSNGCVNKFIAMTVILIQIIAYITITLFLILAVLKEKQVRQQSCYGPNCEGNSWSIRDEEPCMELSTGALISLMLIGFLWADVINIIGICKCNPGTACATFWCLLEVCIAMICGFLTAVFTENDFDAISGAIGILFVHDLDERVFASMEIISRKKSNAFFKKLLALSLWIVVSVIISFSVSCRYGGSSTSLSFFPTETNPCLDNEFKCDDGACIWEGFVCNGIFECEDESDEGEDGNADCDYAINLAAAYGVADGKFMCISTGTWLSEDYSCDGVLDCVDGSDEGRTQNCADKIIDIDCDDYGDFNLSLGTDDWTQVWTGTFKCNSGQCILAEYACDGVAGDCVDGSDEYPYFDQSNIAGTKGLDVAQCPYDQLLECSATQVLCKIDGQCISKLQVCDGVDDCHDGQDEWQCEYSCNDDNGIAYNEVFQCGSSVTFINETGINYFLANGTEIFFDLSLYNYTWTTLNALYEYWYGINYLEAWVDYLTAEDTGACLPYAYRCDGVIDCDDGSDEDDCTWFPCPDEQFQCPTTGACVLPEQLCNGFPNCPDESDELEKTCDEYGATGNTVSCEDLGYPYNYEACSDDPTYCIPIYWFCDSIVDCSDGSDEQVFPNGTVCDGYIDDTTSSSGNSSAITINEIADAFNCAYTPKTEYISTGDRNEYTFIYPAGITSVTFSTCTTETYSFDTKIYLYLNGAELASSDDTDCAFNSYASEIDFTGVEGNTYKIQVGHWADSGSGQYSVSVTCV